MTGYKAYQGNQIEGAGPLGLIILTYDVLNKALARARFGIENNDITMEGEQTVRAIDALLELSSSLNMDEGADVAEDLFRLYSYMSEKLSSTMCTGSPEAINEVLHLSQTLQSGWKELQVQQGKSARSMNRPQTSASLQRPSAMAYGL